MLPELGVGITYSSAIEPLLKERPKLFDVIEVEPQTTWIETGNPAAPYRVSTDALRRIAHLPGRKLVHSVGTPVGGSVRPDPGQLELLQRTVDFFDAPWASDHLSFNTTPEFSTGFFLPPRQTEEGVKTVARAIADLQQALSVPIAVETGVNYLRPRSDEMDDGAFVAAVVEAADCGLLLDLHNIFANAVNGRQPVETFLAQLPLERVWEVHLAGGMEMDGFWLDAHSGAIPDPLLKVSREIMPALPNVKAIIFEIFPAFVRVVGGDVILAQVERLHDLWQTRTSHSSILPKSKDWQRRNVVQVESDVTPAEWEQALGSLVVGQGADYAVAQDLAEDPGVAIINKLIKEFRAGMVVSVLRLTSRYLMLSLSPDAFRDILAEFWSQSPPHQFSATEAEAFAEFLQNRNLDVPHLNKVLEFERAVIATLTDDRTRVVAFDFDPLTLFRALGEGRLPEGELTPGSFEIEITPDGPSAAAGLDIEAVQQAFPFH